MLNAVIPPFAAALRLPFMLMLGFLLTLVLNAVVLQLADDVLESFTVDSFWWALLAAILVAAVSIVLAVLFSADDDDSYSLRVVQRRAATGRC